MTIHFGTPKAIKTIADAVTLYANGEFDSATRSTVPMLALLMHAPDVFNNIIREIGFPDDYDLHFEYTVGPFGGRGKASHTDVMLKTDLDSLAIEGKWTEPMYATVKDWPKRGAAKTANQLAVLQGWLNVFGRQLGKSFDVGAFDEMIYQMIHRAASAAYVGERPRLAYFLFKPSPDPRAAKSDDIFGKLTDLWHLLGKPASFPFYVVEIECKPLEKYEPLRLLVKGEEATTEAVCAALQEPTPLFQFSDYRIRRIG
jgi:hypothetical protein